MLMLDCFPLPFFLLNQDKTPPFLPPIRNALFSFSQCQLVPLHFQAPMTPCCWMQVFFGDTMKRFLMIENTDDTEVPKMQKR